MDIQSFTQSVHSLAKAENKKETGPIGHQVSELAHARNAERKQSVGDMTDESVSLSIGDEPETLVLQTALQGINDALQDTLGDNAIQAAYDANMDVSSESTAERIVSSSMQNFPVFQEQQPDLTPDEALTMFVAIVNEGIEAGFAEAKNVLSGLNVLEGADNASMIDETLASVHEKLQLFVDSFNVQETTQE